jgi:hypothetical protein
LNNDPYENSDAVFGVKNTLVVDLTKITDDKLAQQYDVRIGCALLEYEFVLVTERQQWNYGTKTLLTQCWLKGGRCSLLMVFQFRS